MPRRRRPMKRTLRSINARKRLNLGERRAGSSEANKKLLKESSWEAVMDVKEELEEANLADKTFLNFLPAESVGEMIMSPLVKEEMMIEDVAGNFNTNLPFVRDTYTISEEEFVTGDIKDGTVSDEIIGDFETKFPFVQCEYAVEEEDENLSKLECNVETPHEAYVTVVLDPMSIMSSQEISDLNGTFPCTECGQIFKSKQTFNHHRITFHLQDQSKSCKKCGMTFNKIQSLQKHVKHCLENIVYHCNHCNESFRTKQHLINHKLTEHPAGRSYTCNVCEKQFAQTCYLVQHRRLHHPELSRYKCPCGKSFKTLSGFMRHRKSRHPGEPLNIPKADEATTELGDPDVLSKCSVTLSEKENGGSLDSFGSNTVFESLLKNQLCNPIIDEMKKEEFSCKICGYLCSSTSDLEEHTISHKLNKPFKCIFCVMSFSDREEYLIHRRAHLQTKPFECHKCAKRFSTNEAMFAHLEEKHADDKPFHCNKCRECFSLSTELLSHQQTHSETNVVCKECGVRFNRYSDLIEHESEHPGERPFVCLTCNKQFLHHNTMSAHHRSHLKTKKGRKPHICNTCGKHFLSQHNLQIHNLTHETAAEIDSSNDHDEHHADNQVKNQGEFLTPEHDEVTPAEQVETIEIDQDSDELHQVEEENKKNSTPSFAFIDCGQSYPKLEEFLQKSLETKARAIPSIYTCTQCGQTFTTRQSLADHKTYKCRVKFDKEPSPEKHNNVIADRTATFSTCEYCLRPFMTKALLQTHINKVHVQNPGFSCAICNRTFKLKRHLEEHESVHLRNRHRCNHCFRYFAEKHDFNTHKCKDSMTPIVCNENIMIQGVPKTKRENEKTILKLVGEAIGLEVDWDTVITVHRIPQQKDKDLPAPVVARFKNRQLRDLWLRKYQEKEFLLASDIDEEFPHTRVTIEEHLTLFPSSS